MLFGHVFDGFRRAALHLRGDEGEAFFLITFVHLNQMGHCANAGASPCAPVFDGDDASLLGGEVDFVTGDVFAEFEIGEGVFGILRDGRGCREQDSCASDCEEWYFHSSGSVAGCGVPVERKVLAGIVTRRPACEGRLQGL